MNFYGPSTTVFMLGTLTSNAIHYDNQTTTKKKSRCVCETRMPPKQPSFEKHDPGI